MKKKLNSKIKKPKKNKTIYHPEIWRLAQESGAVPSDSAEFNKNLDDLINFGNKVRNENPNKI
jgi:hypothetical protein